MSCSWGFTICSEKEPCYLCLKAQNAELKEALEIAYRELKGFGHEVNGAVLSEVAAALKRGAVKVPKV